MKNMKSILILEWNKATRRKIQNIKGVYVLRVNKKSIYVGSSSRLVERLRRFYGTGWQSVARTGASFTIEVFPCENLNQMAQMEYDLIKKYNPKNNINCRVDFNS